MFIIKKIKFHLFKNGSYDYSSYDYSLHLYRMDDVNKLKYQSLDLNTKDLDFAIQIIKDLDSGKKSLIQIENEAKGKWYHGTYHPSEIKKIMNQKHIVYKQEYPPEYKKNNKKNPVLIVSVNESSNYYFEVLRSSVFPGYYISDIPEDETLVSNSLSNLKKAVKKRKIQQCLIQSNQWEEWSVQGSLTNSYLYTPKY